MNKPVGIRRPSMDAIVRACSCVWGIPPEDIYGRRRIGTIVKARQAVCHIARLYEISLEGIGAALGRDHSTISHGITAAAKCIRHEDGYRLRIEDAKEIVEDGLSIASDIADDKLSEAIGEIIREYHNAADKYGLTAHSPHEAYAILHEQTDDLWDAVKRNDNVAARAEAVQVAAMAIKMIATIDQKGTDAS